MYEFPTDNVLLPIVLRHHTLSPRKNVYARSFIESFDKACTVNASAN